MDPGKDSLHVWERRSSVSLRSWLCWSNTVHTLLFTCSIDYLLVLFLEDKLVERTPLLEHLPTLALINRIVYQFRCDYY